MKIQKIATVEVDAKPCDLVRDAKGSLWMLFGNRRASLVFANEDDQSMNAALDSLDEDKTILCADFELQGPLTWVGNLLDISRGQLL